MSQIPLRNRLDRPVDPARDHVLGSAGADLTLVEYGSYACPHCRAANEQIAAVRNSLGDRLLYVFRHRPLTGNELARRAAELVERIRDPKRFWDAHVELMTRSAELTQEDIDAVEREFADALDVSPTPEQARRRARERVQADEANARASGVTFTPTFFINGRRYDGPWDYASLSDALLGSLGHRAQAAALDFASWAPSGGVMLLLATALAIVLANSPLGPHVRAFWSTELGLSFGEAGFSMSLLEWIDDALLTVFFLVVGLEIKRELTVGHLASWRSAALPAAAALGGMVVPALFYMLLIDEPAWAHGWGVPMATDTAFAIALIAALGASAPVSLRIFLTAAAIVDDIGSIIVVALFYSGALNAAALAGAAVFTGLLALLGRAHVYRALPYVLAGIGLWLCVHASGLHATLAGIVLAMFIPTRPPPDYQALTAQAEAILMNEARHGGEALKHGPSAPTMRALDEIHDRLESPTNRMLRYLGPQASYLVLPVFALANAGVTFTPDALSDRGPLMLAIACGLALGKPVGIALAAAGAVRLGLAEKPGDYSWTQLVGAAALAGIGFTMSLFIAAQAFPSEADFAAAKLGVFGGSIVAAVAGVGLLRRAGRRTEG